MAPRTDSGLADAWRSLSGSAVDGGWRLIPVERVGECQLSAGRRFPQNSEAVLATFPGARLPSARQLPQGRGFEVTRETLQAEADTGTTIALVREPAGSLELFEAMAEDVIAVVRRGARFSMERLLDQFLQRVAAWQDFMRRPGESRLGNEEEVGLYGELLTLEHILDGGGRPLDAVQGWEGPLDGLQDFVLGNGAIEVKTSIAVTGFPARITSLEQLDDAVRQPLYLAAQRIALTPGGTTLPALVGRLRERLAESGASGLFDMRLTKAGYLDDHAVEYVREFAPASERLFLVDSAFPRITPSTVQAAIRSAVYSIEIDQLTVQPVRLQDALRSLEVI
jgi:hypothetical protein